MIETSFDNNSLIFEDKRYERIKTFNHGKSGTSYLFQNENDRVVFKIFEDNDKSYIPFTI
jgi:hypothetical protein